MPPLHQSESASSSSASSLSSFPARRIRFAPLPDPRALPSPDDDVDDPAHKPCTISPVLPTPAPAPHRPRSLSLLRPFTFRRNPSKEEILTLGTINLFRTSSKSPDSPPSSSSGWRFNLTRLASPTPPLSRTQSNHAHAQLATPTVPGGARTPRRPASLVPKSPQPPLRIGTRMLNGRVYGAPKHSANPFDSARDEDPEFVEWGHGGMGSVRGAEHAGIPMDGPARPCWERLQTAGAVQDDDFDGSGLSWVKKRKEAREREAKERADREKAEMQGLHPQEQQQPSPPPPPPPAEETSPPPEHNLTTVNIPHVARHHHRPSSRSTSADAVPTLPSTTAPRFPSSETDSESEIESNPDEDDDEDDEDDVLQQSRKTALGAGVEKVSRHHD